MLTTPPAAPVKTATKYHVFKEIETGGAKNYEPVDANVEAVNGKAAIKKVAKTNGVYVAIPAKSFQPVKVKLEQTTTIKLG